MSRITIVLSHRHHRTVALSPSYCRTVTIVLSPSYCHHCTVVLSPSYCRHRTVVLSTSYCHHRSVTIVLSHGHHGTVTIDHRIVVPSTSNCRASPSYCSTFIIVQLRFTFYCRAVIIVLS
jgi:hypothetical protein